jgi:prepilin-type N-terminal cleavage/methylation domain-containing protein
MISLFMKDVMKFNTSCLKKHEYGFTLIELVIVIVVSAILIVATLPLFRSSISAFVTTKDVKQKLQSARIAIARLTAELQRVESGQDIISGTATDITFWAPDLGLSTNLAYTFSENTIYRNGTKFIDNVNSVSIKYYEDDGTEKTPPVMYDSSIWRIEIVIGITVGNKVMYLNSQVSPRNIHYN